jgi:hypothetical protein
MRYDLNDVAWSTQQSWHRLAWEFLRRNPAYIQDWQSLSMQKNSDLTMSTQSDSKDAAPEVLFAIDVARPWGLIWLTDPSLDCLAARVFWRTDVSPCIVTISMVPASSSSRSLFTDQLQHALRQEFFYTDEGNHYLFKGVFQDFQFILINYICEFEAADIAFHFCADKSTDAQLNALRSFLVFLSGRSDDLTEGRPFEAKLQRCRQLVALDANMAGASYRDIAILLYGEAAVSSNWHSGHLKDRVRYAVREGKRLMNGGYRELLR